MLISKETNLTFEENENKITNNKSSLRMDWSLLLSQKDDKQLLLHMYFFNGAFSLTVGK